MLNNVGYNMEVGDKLRQQKFIVTIFLKFLAISHEFKIRYLMFLEFSKFFPP